MWLDELCKLCLICSRSKDLIALKRADLIPQLLTQLSQIITNCSSRSEAFAVSFEYVKKLVGSEDPYSEMKMMLMKKIGSVVRHLRSYLEGRGWSVEAALRLSAAANIVDTHVLGYEVESDVERRLWDEPYVEELPTIPTDGEVVIALDNAGEALVDLLLAEALSMRGYKILIAVRSKSYEIDVTKRDLEEIALGKSVEIVETPEALPPITYIERGFIIAKGIANAEAYAEFGKSPSLHLLRAKCDVLAKRFGVPKNSPIIVSGLTLKRLLTPNKPSHGS